MMMITQYLKLGKYFWNVIKCLVLLLRFGLSSSEIPTGHSLHMPAICAVSTRSYWRHEKRNSNALSTYCRPSTRYFPWSALLKSTIQEPAIIRLILQKRKLVWGLDMLFPYHTASQEQGRGANTGASNESVCHWVVLDSLRPHGLQPTRLLCPWDF